MDRPASLNLKTEPTPITCPSCNERVVTRVVYVPGRLTYLAALGLTLIWLV